MRNYLYSRHPLLLLIGLFFVFVYGCKKEPLPTVLFTFSPASPKAGELVTFSNTSENATSYTWNFGDNSNSTSQNPSHTYTSTGTFTITLTATGDGGTSSVIKSVTVSFPLPIASFSMDKTTADVGIVINFTNNSQHSNTFLWEFGDGTTSTEQNPTHAYSIDGTFTVKLTATGDGGTALDSKTITITKPPIIGKWNLIEGKYNGTIISNISGYFEFITNEKYYAKIDKGTSYARSSSYYVISATSFNCTMPSTIILNGMSLWMSGSKSGYTSISMSNNDFTQIGGTAIGYDKTKINYSISGNVLTLSSSNGMTILKYQK